MILNASANNIPLADKSVHAVVTSPPYFGLRRYAGAQDVNWPEGVYAPMTGCPPCVEVPAMRCPLGNEPTIEAFIWHLLLVMRELKRVLRDDGACWVNLGDSYSADRGYQVPDSKHKDVGNSLAMKMSDQIANGNLMAIPHRFALAAQADGWTLRNDCVWHKKSCMPESVSGWKFQDDQLKRGSWRHTRAHEYVFQFVKGMGYWSDSEIVKEANAEGSGRWGNYSGTVTANAQAEVGGKHGASSAFTSHMSREEMTAKYYESGRNPRSVFSPSPSNYTGAHFATFPKELIRPLILSSVPRKTCPECGQGWAATVIASRFGKASSETKYAENEQAGSMSRSRQAYRAKGLEGPPMPKVTGYAPTCECGREDYKPGIVLDPFVGSGTTLEVARECGVQAIGLDISHEYLESQASWRGLQIAKPDFSKMPLFAEAEAA